MIAALYNEIDRGAAQWMRELVSGGHIADGVVDERSIVDLRAADVAGPGARHFFAGIGGWSYALRLAGVADTASIWTGSCPCQPFSSAGRGAGTADARHLWPEWFRLIAECRPAVIFGEQVASAAGLGWLDAVFADLEGAGYACAAADLCAAGVGAPHIRQRLYFVAYADGESGRLLAAQRQPGRADAQVERGREAGTLADRSGARLEIVGEQQARRQLETAKRGCSAGRLGHSDGESSGRERGPVSRTEAEAGGAMRGRTNGSRTAGGHVDWTAAEWIACSDGKSRPVEPGTHPLAHGVPGRVGLLRGYGNAIVPWQAAEFIGAALDAIGGVI